MSQKNVEKFNDWVYHYSKQALFMQGFAKYGLLIILVLGFGVWLALPPMLGFLKCLIVIALVVAIPIGLYLLYQARLQKVLGAARIDLTSDYVRRGETITVVFSQPVRQPMHIRHVVCQLMKRELATHGSGSSSTTEKHEEIVTQVAGRGAVLDVGQTYTEQFTLTIPAHVMHSFKATNNEIHWYVMVDFQLSVWPHRRVEREPITIRAD